MKARSVRIIATALLMTVFLIAGQIQARIPQSEKAAAYECRGVTRMVYKSLFMLSQEHVQVLLGAPKGIQPVTRQLLDKLLSLDPNSFNKAVYEQVMELEAGVSKCRYYIIFNFVKPFKKESFVVCDTKHAYYGDVDLENAPTTSPKGLFKSLCEKYDVLEGYELYADDFIEETHAEQLRKKYASSRSSVSMKFLATYWLLLPLLALFEFVFCTVKHLSSAGEGVKFYCLGLFISSTILVLSCVPLYYFNTPLPDSSAFILIPDGSYPKEIHKLTDVILYVSFGWWGISILTVLMAGKEQGLRMLALAYVVFGPIALSLSESPFGGNKEALPMLGMILIVVNVFYIKSWVSEPVSDQAQNQPPPPSIDLPPVQE